MNNLLKPALACIALFLVAACDEGGKSAQMNSSESVNISSVSFQGVRWDEIVAADTAASVKNNNLIMMR